MSLIQRESSLADRMKLLETERDDVGTGSLQNNTDKRIREPD